MKVVSLIGIAFIAFSFCVDNSRGHSDRCKLSLQLDSISYNEDRLSMRRFLYDGSGNLSAVISGSDTIHFVYSEDALIKINKGSQHVWENTQYYALDENSRVSQGLSKDQNGNMQIQSGFEYDDSGRLGYLFYADYMGQTIQQFAYQYPSQDIKEIMVTNLGQDTMYKYEISFDTVYQNCFNLDLNGIGYDIFPTHYLGKPDRFQVATILQFTVTGDTLAYLKFSPITLKQKGVWEQIQTDVLNGFSTAITYYTSEK